MLAADPDRDLLLRRIWTRIAETVTLPGLERDLEEAWRPYAHYRDDPVAYVHDILGETTWEAQDYTLESIVKHPQTAVRAARGVSKTRTLSGAVPHFMCTRPAIVLTFGAGERSMKGQLWAEIGDRAIAAAARGKKLPGTVELLHWRIGPRHYAQGITANADTSAVGFHGGRFVPPNPNGEYTEEELEQLEKAARAIGKIGLQILLVFDEAQTIQHRIFQAMKGSLQGSGARSIIAGNPLLDPDQGHEFAEAFKDGSDYHRIVIRAEADPNDDVPFDKEFIAPSWLVKPKWVAARKREWGEDDPRFLSDVRARFSAAVANNQFIPRHLLLANENLELPDDGDPRSRHIGVDISRKGTDWCVASLWINGALAAEHEWRSEDLMATAGIILELMEAWSGVEGKLIPARNVHVDDCGLGGGVVDRLRQMNQQVDAVDVGAGPQGDWSRLVGEQQFQNRKAELWWAFRCALIAGLACVPRKYGKVWTQLGWHTYDLKPAAKGSVIVHSTDKDEIKELYKRSPDNADAAVLGWSRTGDAQKIIGHLTAKRLRALTRR